MNYLLLGELGGCVCNNFNDLVLCLFHRAPLPDVMAGAGGAGAAPVDLPQIDMSWIEQKSKKAAMKLEKLDADLKNYKSNSIKESIRRGHDDLAEHYLDIGDLNNALKCFSRARDYCTSAKHVVHMCLNVIKVKYNTTVNNVVM
jgi:COP9 signalosome complex subunit 1